MLEVEGKTDDLVVDPLTEAWALELESICGGNCDKCKHRKQCQRLWDRMTNAQTVEKRKRLYKRLWPEIKSLVGER